MTVSRRLMILCGCLMAFGAAALDIHEKLADPQQQALYERLTKEVRCLVCQNQPIADSSAPLAADLRREIQERVAAGQTERQIKTFLTDRYGDFVLYKPRFGGPALLLWLAPGLLLVLGGVVIFRVVRRRIGLPVNLDDEPAPDELRDSAKD